MEKENIIISNKIKLEKIKRKISQAGSDKLHIITDFDRTLTKEFVNGKRIPSVISILRDGNYLTKDYSTKAHALFDKYHPIETNPNISLEEKKKAMQEWWTSHYKLLIESGLNKKDIEAVINSGKIKLRKGVLEFIDLLHEHNIPLVIMSSSGLGIGSISMFFEKQGKLYDNIHIISNDFKWGENGNITEIKEPIIHSMNKDETSVKNFPEIFKAIKDRKNVLLLGDNLEDVNMIKGFDYPKNSKEFLGCGKQKTVFQHANIIKIGFLNQKVEENLEAYKKAYDVVILNDSNMFFVNELLKELCVNF